MRKTSMLITKNHFIFLIKTSNVYDELYCPEQPPNGNPIGFLISGSANTFISSNGASWNPYTSSQSQILHTRSNNCFFGAVATSNDVLYTTIIPREDSTYGTWKTLNNANPNEINMIENTTDTAFQLNDQCNLTNKRDLQTFDVIPIEQFINTNDIEDDDIILS